MNASAAPLPPGPRLPALAQTVWALRDPVGFLQRCADRYGDIFRVRFLRFPTYVYVADPALAREVYATDRTVGHAGPTRKEFLEPLVGENSLLCLEGEEWLRQRKLIGPAFHRRQVERYDAQIVAIARDHLERWPREGVVQLRPLMQAMTLDVILRLVLGVSDPRRLERLREVLPGVVDPRAAIFLWALPDRAVARLSGSPLARRVAHPLRRFFRLRDELDAIVYAEIADRRSGAVGGEDVLSQLVAARDEAGRAMSDVELRDEMLTLLEAGHETTATALSWAFERLVRTPAVLGRLRRELAAGDEDYLDAVVKESLRHRSVVLDTPRVLSAPLEIGGYRLPEGTYVAPALPLVQHSASAFEDPEAFNPERFLDGGAGRDGFVAFGGGKRHCVGSHLALLELKVILAETLRRYDVTAVTAADEAARPAHVTLVPADLARVRVRRRADAGSQRAREDSNL